MFFLEVFKLCGDGLYLPTFGPLLLLKYFSLTSLFSLLRILITCRPDCVVLTYISLRLCSSLKPFYFPVLLRIVSLDQSSSSLALSFAVSNLLISSSGEFFTYFIVILILLFLFGSFI